MTDVEGIITRALWRVVLAIAALMLLAGLLGSWSSAPGGPRKLAEGRSSSLGTAPLRRGSLPGVNHTPIPLVVALFAPIAMAAVEAPKLDGTTWVLSSLHGQPVTSDRKLTLSFAGGKVSGSDGCNRFSAPVAQDASELRISPTMAATRMACAPEVMKQAGVYTGALTRARGARVDGLLDAGGKPLALLEAIYL
jgi:heat shock protein HslJ